MSRKAIFFMHHPLVATILHATADRPDKLAAGELSTDVLQAWLAAYTLLMCAASQGRTRAVQALLVAGELSFYVNHHCMHCCCAQTAAEQCCWLVISLAKSVQYLSSQTRSFL